jgi:Fusaric acid resistance protein-like
METKTVLTDFSAQRFPKPETVQSPQVMAAMLGLAGPLAVGALTGHLQAGMAAALGGLALSGAGRAETAGTRIRALIFTTAAGAAAMLTGAAVAGHGSGTACAIPAIAAAAGLSGGISRTMARAGTLFILYTVIAVHLSGQAGHPIGLTLFFLVGGIWTAGLAVILKTLRRAVHPVEAASGAAPSGSRPMPGARQLLRRWCYTLTRFSGWQYALRITLCLAAAQAVQWIWPSDHAYWIAVTVVVVVHRNLPTALARTLQRAAGTALGVILISPLLIWPPPLWLTIAVIGALAAARPIFKAINYAAYATIHTPLILLLLNFGQAPSWQAAMDRLAATLTGCGLALMLGYLAWSTLGASARRGLEHPAGRP